MARKAVGANTVDCDSYHVPYPVTATIDVNGLQIGRSSDQLAIVAPRLFDQNVHSTVKTGGIESMSLAMKQVLQNLQPLSRDGIVTLERELGCGSSRAWRVLEGEGARILHFAHKLEGSREVLLGLAGKSDDEVTRNRDIGAR